MKRTATLKDKNADVTIMSDNTEVTLGKSSKRVDFNIRKNPRTALASFFGDKGESFENV